MIFQCTDGHEVELRILGYQFPDDTSGGWDSNWLRVYIRVKAGAGTRESVDPSLTTWELARMTAWFEELARGAPPRARELTFTEPDLSFTLENDATDPVKRVRLGINRNWDLEGGRGGGETILDIEADTEELLRMYRGLRDELEKFPERKPGV
jgi:hypothetical protein